MRQGFIRAFLAAILAVAAGQAAAQATDQAPRVVVYKTAGDQALSAHLFAPGDGAAEPRPAVLMFHGGGWVAGEPAWTYAAARRMQALGLVAIPIQYRLSGEAATPVDALADACDAFAWVRTHAAALGVDPQRVAGYGVSAGGHLAAAAGLGACAEGIKGPDLLLLWSPALDLARDGWLRRLLGGADPTPISPLSLAPGGGPPAVIVQGEADTLTPTRGAQAFCDALTQAGGACALHLYPGLGHLLTRNLDSQERDFDPDPAARADGEARLDAFLVAHGYGQEP